MAEKRPQFFLCVHSKKGGGRHLRVGFWDFTSNATSGVYRIFERGGALRIGVGSRKFYKVFYEILHLRNHFFGKFGPLHQKFSTFSMYICAQILFKTDILNFFPPKRGGLAHRSPPPLYTPLIATKLFLPGFEMHRIKLDHFFYLYYSTERNFVNRKFIL